MRSPTTSFVLLRSIALTLLLATPTVAQPPVDPSGHWEGTIEVPGTELQIAIDLARDGDGLIAGTFSQPKQRIKGLPLSAVAVEGRAVRLVLRPGSGGGTFNGTLSADTRTLSGDFVADEGGYALAFSLSRTGDAVIAPAPKSAPIDARLEGTWQGSLDVAGKAVRVVVTMANHADATATGTVVSPDGSGVQIPIAMTQKGGEVSIDVPSTGASFTGALDTAGRTLAGAWSQGGASLPLTFQRVMK